MLIKEIIPKSEKCKKYCIQICLIEDLFKEKKEIYQDNFKVSDKYFSSISTFKTNRAGYVFYVVLTNKVAAFFTLSYINKFQMELGDICKLDKSVPREVFAKLLNESFEWAIQSENSVNAIIGYPNPKAIPLEIAAGMRVHKYYAKQYSLVIFNFLILMPFIKSKNNISLISNYFNHKIFKKTNNLEITRIRKMTLPIYKKPLQEREEKNIVILGLLYEFIECNNGETMLIYSKDQSIDIQPIFENSDNSA